MNKKIWLEPKVINIGIEQTQGGGKVPVTHDGVMYEKEDGTIFEGYYS